MEDVNHVLTDPSTRIVQLLHCYRRPISAYRAAEWHADSATIVQSPWGPGYRSVSVSWFHEECVDITD